MNLNNRITLFVKLGRFFSDYINNNIESFERNKFDKAINLINLALEKINDSKDKNFFYFPNAIKLKTEINVALNRDRESGDMLKDILKEKFYPDIFYLLCSLTILLI